MPCVQITSILMAIQEEDEKKKKQERILEENDDEQIELRETRVDSLMLHSFIHSNLPEFRVRGMDGDVRCVRRIFRCHLSPFSMPNGEQLHHRDHI